MAAAVKKCLFSIEILHCSDNLISIDSRKKEIFQY